MGIDRSRARSGSPATSESDARVTTSGRARGQREALIQQPGGMGGAQSQGMVFATVERAANWARSNSLWPLSFGLACCAIEMMSMSAARFDVSRFGSEIFRVSPRQADLMIVAGRVSQKMAPVLRQLYDQMPEPKWVIAMGACASCGGVYNNYALVQGVDKIVPVDVFLAGCPPRPEALIFSLMQLQEMVKRGERRTIAVQ